MSFYEHTLVAKQDLSSSEVKNIEEKYQNIINKSSGKVIKVEKWGLLSFAKKIRAYNKGFYIHYKFEGNNETLDEINKKIKVDNLIIRNLIVKYKQLNLKDEYFKNEKK